VHLAGSGGVRNDGVLYADTFEASVAGSGDMRLEVAITSHLDAVVSGSGELVLRGAADHVDITVSGSGVANLRGVSTQNAVVTVAGSGEANVYASAHLDARVSGSGDVFYYGDPPNVTRTITGSGSINGR